METRFPIDMTASKFEFTTETWQKALERVEYKTSIFALLKRDMVYPEERLEGSFYVLESADWINVIAVTPEQDIVLVEQYRFGIQEATLELPGGMVDPGEDTLLTAKRELAEETGFVSDDWQYLGKVSSNPAIQTNYTHTFLARDCSRQQSQRLGKHEFIKVHILAMSEFLGLVSKGIVHHALVLAAIAQYLLAKPGSQFHIA
jgi:8-oxo-dGTP pyrophosphatase MutT (NUDIX family)